MRNGRRWLALDADLFGNTFTAQLLERFGWAGVGVWIAFLCACKRSPTQGQIHYFGEAEALMLLDVVGLPLVDNSGEKWTLDDFWTFTGRMKQTRRTSRGRVRYVKSTHWERWQKSVAKQSERERKAYWRAEKRPEPVRTPTGTTNGTHLGPTERREDIDKEKDKGCFAEDEQPNPLVARARQMRGAP
jgi:hypothetical protein